MHAITDPRVWVSCRQFDGHFFLLGLEANTNNLFSCNMGNPSFQTINVDVKLRTEMSHQSLTRSQSSMQSPIIDEISFECANTTGNSFLKHTKYSCNSELPAHFTGADTPLRGPLSIQSSG